MLSRLTLNDSVSVPDSVLSRELDGETVVLNLESGVYFGLDPVATDMWNEIRERASLRAALDALLASYDGDASEIESDFLALADTLVAKGLIIRRPS